MSVIEIIEAASPDQLSQVAALLRDYLLWMRRRYRKHAEMIDAYFDQNEWQSELADLAGHYGAPFGAIVLALVDGIPAGCVMIRGLQDETCEMKRLFVRPAFRGLGLAHAMVRRLARLADKRGYVTMRLETGLLQTEALALYRSMGFRPIEPYHACAQWLIDNGRFMEVDVGDLGTRAARTARNGAVSAVAA